MESREGQQQERSEADLDIVRLFSPEQISQRLDDLAADIDEQYRECEGVIIVGLLRGSFIFIADLVRRLNIMLEVDFMSVSSYGNATVSSGDVRILKDLDTNIENRHVIVIEDIVDTGNTLTKVIEVLNTRNPRSIKVCAMLDKPSRREVPVNVDWVGFEIPNVFVLGYGIDCRQSLRNLPFIAYVREDAADETVPVGIK